MSLETWWPLLSPATRDWLIANNGDRLSASVLDDIAQVLETKGRKIIVHDVSKLIKIADYK